MPFIAPAELPVKEPRPGWRGRFFHSDHMTFVYYDIEPGSSVRLHQHPNEEVWHVIEGELTMTLDGAERTVRAGEAVVVPADVEHAASTKGRCRAIVVDYPVRTRVGGIDVAPPYQIKARSLLERRAAAVEHLRSNTNLWLATSSDGRGPHLIPVSYWWDGSRLTTATFDGSRTLENVRAQPKVRTSIGSTGDVLMIDATATVVPVADIDAEAAEGYAQASGNDPRSAPGFAYVRLQPRRMQVWKGVAEFAGRTVMRGGVWLDDPVD